MNVNPYIYILYYQSKLNYRPPNLSVILIKSNISFVTEVLEQTGRETRKHNVVAIRE